MHLILMMVRNCQSNDNVMSTGYTQIKLCALCSVITSVDEKIIDKKAKAKIGWSFSRYPATKDFFFQSNGSAMSRG